MKFLINLFPVFVIYLIFSSCDPVAPGHVNEIAPLSFDTISFERKGGICEEPGANCITINLKYPKAVDGKTSSRDSINRFIEKAVLDNLAADPDHEHTSINAAADTMINYYLEELKEMPEYDLAWDVTVEGKAEIIDSIAVITMASYSFLGGAHPNFYISFLNYNLNTGKEIKLDDLIIDKAGFLKLAERKFGASRSSEYENHPFDMDEFFWGEGFQLPANFAIKKDGILLYYNPYEAAPYVLGSTEYLIFNHEMKGLTKLGN